MVQWEGIGDEIILRREGEGGGSQINNYEGGVRGCTEQRGMSGWCTGKGVRKTCTEKRRRERD